MKQETLDKILSTTPIDWKKILKHRATMTKEQIKQFAKPLSSFRTCVVGSAMHNHPELVKAWDYGAAPADTRLTCLGYEACDLVSDWTPERELKVKETFAKIDERVKQLLGETKKEKEDE